MSVDLSSFLDSGSLLGGITQRICELLSVQDLLEFVSSVTEPSSTADSSTPEHLPDREKTIHSLLENGTRSGAEFCASGESGACSREAFTSAGGPSSSKQEWSDFAGHYCGRHVSPPEEEIPRGPGGGDEAGGGTRSNSTRPSSTPYEHRAGMSGGHEGLGGDGGAGGTTSVDRKRVVKHQQEYQQRHQRHQPESRARGGASEETAAAGEKQQQGSFNLLGTLIGLGLQTPLAALGVIQGGVSHVLRGVPLLALLRWAAGGAEMVFGVTFKMVLLPYDVTKGVISYVVGTLESMLNVATEIWSELRHLSLAELACVVSCVVSGNSIPQCLLPPHDADGEPYSGRGFSGGASCVLGARFHGPRFSPTGSDGSMESATGPGFTSDYPRGRARSGPGSMHSEDSRSGMSGSRSAWRQAHAMRRRLDRVNRTASLVSYEEREESAVPRAKAQRVRRRMHYAMSLQCFQATVTVDGRSSPSDSGGCGDDDGGDSRGGAGTGSAGPFMCTPQSFPPTPVSRAHVMQRTSQFADDILYLARDQLRLGENLKPGVDETTRATADFLRRQQRLAVLDGNNACDGISLTCGHHCATKIGPSLYSSVRAMVPVLRNRHVYFQVSCKRDGPLAPCIGVGLSTPEMPLSTLVGAFSNSVGLCSTGQMLMSSRWYGVPGEYAVRKNGMSTVGVLVYLDGSRSFRSWDGDMIRALVCFSVDGRLVRVSTPGSSQHQQQPQQQQQHQQQLQQRQQCPSTAARIAVSNSAVDNAGSNGTHCSNINKNAVVQQQGLAAPPLPPLPPLPLPPVTAPGVVSFGPMDLAPMAQEVAPWEPAATAAIASASSGVGSAFGGLGGTMNAVAGAHDERQEGAGASAALGLALPKDRDLFPTVTIHSSNTETLCRFCAEDLLPTTRDAIGAPPGVPVYSLDGSLINLP